MILMSLGLIHFLGFERIFGFAASLPTKEPGERVLNPKKTDSDIVAIDLTAFSI